MAKFEKFDAGNQIRGLAEAARQIQIEELIRDGKMPSFDRVVAAFDETRQEYRTRILAARRWTRKSGAYELMKTSRSLQEFLQLITADIRKISPEEKAEFRAPWLAYVVEKEKMRENDRRFLRSCGVNPDGD